MPSKHDLISLKASGVCAGVAFFGGINSNFQMIIKCPIHVYTVIKKNLQGSLHDIQCCFFSGSIEITDLALPMFCGNFLYKTPDKKKVKKYHAAFVYPLMADYMVSSDEFSTLMSFCALLDLAEYKYYDKQNRSVREILNCFQLPASALLEGFEESFCCVSADKVK